MGVGVPHGCEAVVHACREYISVCSADNTVDRVLVKVDMRNAFNSVRRDVVLGEIGNRCPDIFPLVRQAYGTSSPLYFGDELIESCTGVQQGDPLGPLAFALAIDSAV